MVAARHSSQVATLPKVGYSRRGTKGILMFVWYVPAVNFSMNLCYLSRRVDVEIVFNTKLYVLLSAC